MWKQPKNLEAINQFSENTLVSHLGIRFTEIGDDFLEATMPVAKHNTQPLGLLHGGASAALAETLGSVASVLCLSDPTQASPVGLELNINHLSSAKEGIVIGRATAIKIGRRTHVWNIDIRTIDGKSIAVSRLTTMIIERK